MTRKLLENAMIGIVSFDPNPVINHRFDSVNGATQNANVYLSPGMIYQIRKSDKSYFWCTEEDKWLINKGILVMKKVVPREE
jgi:hypothetical protein